MLNELDRIALTVDLPEHSLEAGDVGMILHNYNHGEGYEVEFVTFNGDLVALVALYPSQIRPLGKHEISHVRSFNNANLLE
jgi:hypothetical protein